MNLRIGQKVVCVRDDFSDPKWERVPNRPRRGNTYTVRHIGMLEFADGDHEAIWLEEIINPVRGWRIRGQCKEVEYGFWSARFRPLIERKTDAGMVILREIIDRESHQDKTPVTRTVHS